MRYEFDVKKVTEDCVKWIQGWFEENGPGCKVVLGMSGGKDSTIIATLCSKALGPENVIGVSMPDKGQSINEADEICKYLGIRYINAPIENITSGFKTRELSTQAEQNIPPRIRMTMLYAIAQTENGRVACCDNASENYIGYSTLFGDQVGSFAPLLNLTVSEVLQIGDYLEIPSKWVHKTPDDGLPHSQPDEEKFGFTYSELDTYIRQDLLNFEKPANERVGVTIGTAKKIEQMHKSSQFKRDIVKVPAFEPVIESPV